MRFFITLVLILAASGLICSQTDINALNTLCNTESCCESLQEPNPTTGVGYLEFQSSCANDGGLHCLGITGCQRCFNPSGRGPNLGNRPVCRRFSSTTTGQPSTTGETTGTTTGGSTTSCPNQACCDRRSRPDFETGIGFWEFDPVCLGGGVGCVNRTGCRRCFNPHGSGPNQFNEPWCTRFLPCNSTRCCTNIQFPNNRTGEGYYQYAPRCIPNGGLHCVENTGCEICFSIMGGGPNHGNRPPCTRFLPCRTDDCCALLQVPISTGEGFLQFSNVCTRGSPSSHCVFGASGCQSCFNPLGSGPNAQNVPVCTRFRG